MKPVILTIPCNNADVLKTLKCYDEVRLNGTLLVARDQAHSRLYTLIQEGKELPVSIKNQTIYYMGPTPTPPGRPIGSCGPTTSARMDAFAPELLRFGVIAMVGKGPRSKDVLDAIKETGAIYFQAYGGCGALYASKVKKAEVVAFADLGPEAIMRLEVEDFPVVVAADTSGATIFA